MNKPNYILLFSAILVALVGIGLVVSQSMEPGVSLSTPSRFAASSQWLELGIFLVIIGTMFALLSFYWNT